LQQKYAGKPLRYIREQISRRASKHGIASHSAQILWARELGIGVSRALARATPEVREEVRLAPISNPSRPLPSPHSPRRSPTGLTVKALISDRQLFERCHDLLRAKRHFDRVIREATTLLDDRLKSKTGLTMLNPENLVNRAINPDPAKAIIEVSATGGEQAGFHSICKGIMLAFRHKAHHSITESFTKEDALKFCGFMDTVLGTIEKSTIHLDRV
jgi:hypothetical protein